MNNIIPNTLIGKRFGKLVVIARTYRRMHHCIVWLCRCDCGKECFRSTERLNGRRATSCGSKECGHKGHSLHGMHATKEYTAYTNARARCERPTCDRWEYYGGRGIEFRFNGFDDFFAEVGFAPSPKHSLDRIDPNGHYEKGNLRWATVTEQARNQRKRGRLSQFTTAELWEELLSRKQDSPFAGKAISVVQ